MQTPIKCLNSLNIYSLYVLDRKLTDTKTAIISKRITRFCKLSYINYILLVFTYVERDNVNKIHTFKGSIRAATLAYQTWAKSVERCCKYKKLYIL